MYDVIMLQYLEQYRTTENSFYSFFNQKQKGTTNDKDHDK